MSTVLPPAVAAAALADAEAAVAEYEGAVAWFSGRVDSYRAPIAVEVWVLDPSLTRVLLVEHRWRGWVPPGGKAEPGEVPRAAAARELLEETGLRVELLGRLAAAMVRAYHPDWPHALGLTYAAIADPTAPLVAEPSQPVAWTSLDAPWASSFPDDIDRIRSYVAWSSNGAEPVRVGHQAATDAHSPMRRVHGDGVELPEQRVDRIADTPSGRPLVRIGHVHIADSVVRER